MVHDCNAPDFQVIYGQNKEDFYFVATADIGLKKNQGKSLPLDIHK